MAALQYTGGGGFYPPMARASHRQTPPLSEAQRLGLALRGLRRRLELSQARAAEMANTHQQTWQRYEAGENDALLKVTLQRRLAEAIGSDHEELLMELDKFGGLAPSRRPPTGMSERALRPFEFHVRGHVRAGPQGLNVYDVVEPETIDLSGFLGEDARVLRLAGESMIPYAEPGGFVTYNLRRSPGRNKGCVVELLNGDFYVKRYDRTDMAANTLHVTELHPAERALTFDLAEVKGVYAVGLRGD